VIGRVLGAAGVACRVGVVLASVLGVVAWRTVADTREMLALAIEGGGL
jgi:hypothetical protein